MSTAIFKTENAVFEFYLENVREYLKILTAENNVDEADRLLKLIATSSCETILITKEHDYFGYVALDLIDAEKGSIICKACNKIYKADELKPIAVGQCRIQIVD